jgi:hypothetical protein
MPRSYAEEEQDIPNALLYGALQENPNWRGIADKFDVNYRRLLARKRGRGDRSNCDDHNKSLTPDQETGLIRIFENMEHRELHCRYRMISSVANFILANAHNDPETSPLTVGKNWTRNFFKCNPEFRTRISKPLSFDRKWAHDPDAIMDWYSGLLRTIARYEVVSDDIWNFDETGFSIGVGGPQRIVTKIQN